MMKKLRLPSVEKLYGISPPLAFTPVLILLESRLGARVGRREEGRRRSPLAATLLCFRYKIRDEMPWDVKPRYVTFRGKNMKPNVLNRFKVFSHTTPDLLSPIFLWKRDCIVQERRVERRISVNM